MFSVVILVGNSCNLKGLEIGSWKWLVACDKPAPTSLHPKNPNSETVWLSFWKGFVRLRKSQSLQIFQSLYTKVAETCLGLPALPSPPKRNFSQSAFQNKKEASKQTCFISNNRGSRNQRTRHFPEHSFSQSEKARDFCFPISTCWKRTAQEKNHGGWFFKLVSWFKDRDLEFGRISTAES